MSAFYCRDFTGEKAQIQVYTQYNKRKTLKLMGSRSPPIQGLTIQKNKKSFSLVLQIPSEKVFRYLQPPPKPLGRRDWSIRV